MAACRSYGRGVRSVDTPSLTPRCKGAIHATLLSHRGTSRLPASHSQPKPVLSVSRRNLLELGLGLGLGLAFPILQPVPVAAEGSRFARHIDTFDGYAFSYPQAWIQVRGAGADVFFRDPVHLDENVSVEISSPSSSRFKEVSDLGSPDQAAQKVLKQYLTEFMSTRIGVRRESKIVSASSKMANDGREYYEVQVNVKSYANNQQLAVMPQDRVVQLEWDRRYLSVLGVENNRLYELRLQVPEYVLSKEEGELQKIMDSFIVFKV
ncbi:hypothetical protein GOP47_0021717 [Adiantum capillus-veneris]|uniref:PsbP C-terminal domain-containing protein n=1 Tax=Adiantum capillus-veneris TaxID=13818 RepID=A0A9D4U892_ADICA|nr:hypothetical protein GOP47_0021717 [Adiantum capillus-veneris]